MIPRAGRNYPEKNRSLVRERVILRPGRAAGRPDAARERGRERLARRSCDTTRSVPARCLLPFEVETRDTGKITGIPAEQGRTAQRGGNPDGNVRGTAARGPELAEYLGRRGGDGSEKGTIPSSANKARAVASCSGVLGPRENSYQATALILIVRPDSATSSSRRLSGPAAVSA